MLKQAHALIKMCLCRACVVHSRTCETAGEKDWRMILNENLETEKNLKVLKQSKLGSGRLPPMAMKLLSVGSYH